MEKQGFIYLWYDKKRKMYYIGSHWGTVDDGYICSSNRMRDAYRRRPQDFKRRLVKSNIPRSDLLEEEHRWLSFISDNELGKKYYNLRKHRWGHWSTDIDSRMTVAEKISVAKKGKGYNHTEETKKKIREARAKQVIKSGWKLSEETKLKMKKPKPQRTEEHKRNMSLAKKGCTPWNKGLRT